MKRRFFVWLAPFFLTVVTCQAWGWSAQGHGDIAVAALEQLPKSLQQEYRSVLMAGPWAKGKVSWHSAASRAAAWPDRVKSQPLSKLFSQYGSGKVLTALQAYYNRPTSDWHYTNALFINPLGKVVEANSRSSAKACPPSREGKLMEIWPKLFSAYHQAKDPRDKAIVLAFVLHLVGDAYQPLHLLGSLDDQCRHDRGGNGFCVAPVVGFKAGLRCRDSLHFLWDKGFGAFEDDLTVKARLRGDPRSLTPAQDAVKRIAKNVYPEKPSHSDTPAYQNRSRRQASQMAQLASGHLASALESLARK